MVAVVELGPEHTDEALAVYREYEWWEDREPGDLREALAESLAVGLRLEPGAELAAMARVVTDYVYYAKVYDVIVAEDLRQTGLGRELMAAVVDHPDLADLNLELACREGLIPFYRDCGFEEYDVTVDVADGDGGEEPLVTMMYWRQRPDE